MARVVAVIHVTPMGDELRGLWCDRCCLPSGVGTTLGMSTDTSPIAVRRCGMCEDCGRQIADPYA